MRTRMNWIWFFTFWLYFPLSAGRQGFGPGEQDWGYITVRKNAHMFWWLYYVNPPIKPNNFNVFQRPLLIWLQGGPGVSSTGFGNFEEIGPLDTRYNPRNYTWVNNYNVLFIDQPVGTGFSYVDSQAGYATFISQNIQDIYNCVKGIFKKFKEFEKVPIYILGESYGGRMVVKLAQSWYRKQSLGLIKSNLKGIALGNSWISPIDAIRSWAPYLLEMGMIDTVGFSIIENYVQQIIFATNKRKWILAKKLMDYTMEIIYSITDDVNVYNVLTERNHNFFNHIFFSSVKISHAKRLRHLMNFNVTSALGISNRTWTILCRKVYNLYIQDFLKSVTHTVEYLLNHTDLEIIVYHGHLDMIIPIHSTLTWLENLQWKYSPEWYNESRVSFKVNGTIQGYVKSYRNLKMYWIIRAGHMVPKDNPFATSAILQAMTEGN